MRHIRKGAEPDSFEQWKAAASVDWQPSWKILGNPEKAELKSCLLRDQGNLCCYCCRLLLTDNSHIEHVQPRETFPNDALTYTNLLACCMGEAEDPPPQQRHCGHEKGNWYDPALFVSPLSPDCEQYFSYTAYGEIRASHAAPNPVAAKETVDRLKLDCMKLRRLRRSALDSVVEDLSELTTDDLATFISRLRDLEDAGRPVEFQPAIIGVLSELVP